MSWRGNLEKDWPADSYFFDQIFFSCVVYLYIYNNFLYMFGCQIPQVITLLEETWVSAQLKENLTLVGFELMTSTLDFLMLFWCFML